MLPSCTQELPLCVHAAPQLAVPGSAEGKITRLLPLHMEVYAPPALRASLPFDLRLACIRVRATHTTTSDAAGNAASHAPPSLVACVTHQPPAYVDVTTLPSDALLCSDVAQRIFLPHTVTDHGSSPHPQLRTEFTPLPSHALPLWASVRLRIVPQSRQHAALRNMHPSLHPLFPAAPATGGSSPMAARARPSLSHILSQLVDKPLFALGCRSPRQPLLLLCADGCYRAVEAVQGKLDPMYAESADLSSDDPLCGWGMVSADTALSWCDQDGSDGAEEGAGGTAVFTTASGSVSPQQHPINLSIDTLFDTYLPSFQEGLSASDDAELKGAALLLKLFATERAGNAPSIAAAAPSPPPSLLHPRSLLLSGPRGVGKQCFVTAVCRLLGLQLRRLTFGNLILRRNVSGQTEALRAELAEVRQGYMRKGGEVDGDDASRSKLVLLLPSLDLTFASSDERDEDALGMQSEMLAFLRELAADPVASSRVMLVGLTAARGRLAPLLLQAFQFRFQMSQPSDEGRRRILQAHLGLHVETGRSTPASAPPPPPPLPRLPFDASGVHVSWVVEQTHGFVGADLVGLIKTAVAHASQLQRQRQADASNVPSLSTTPPTPLRLTNDDFHHALQRVRPASLKALNVISKPRGEAPPSLVSSPADEVASVTAAPSSPPPSLPSPLSDSSSSFSSVGGLSSVKATLRECLLWPSLHRRSFRRLGIRPPRGLLLYGVPGVGKTLIARTVARECNLNFMVCSLPELLQAGVGESEKRVRELFQRARAVAPAVIFLDEIQAVFSSGAASSEGGGNDMSAKLMAQLLTQIDQLHGEEEEEQQQQGQGQGQGQVQGEAAGTSPAPGLSPLPRSSSVFVLAATNLPSALDPSLLRSGRLDRVLYVGPPDESARLAILLLQRKGARWSPELQDRIGEVARRTEGFSAVDIVHLAGRAGLCALQRAPLAPPAEMEVRFEDFEGALAQVASSITREMVDTCIRWGKKFARRNEVRRKGMQWEEEIQASMGRT